MILKFPDLDTLRFALDSGTVPPAVSGAPAVAGLDDQGAVWIDPRASLSTKVQTELRKHGVQVAKSGGTGPAAEVSCWLEMLPLVKDPGAATAPELTPVLFDLPGPQMARLAGEVLRLGNDRQSFRWLDDGRKGAVPRALLRVVGPPYYSLLRALEGRGQADAPRAFIERAPRVWVELGYAHPLTGKIKPPAGQMLLLRPPRQWTFLPEAPFRDIYDVLEFQLSGDKLTWKEGEVDRRLSVSLSLRRAGAPESAELWVLRDDPVGELDRLVQNADDQLLARLSFAVGEKGGKKTIVLRVRPSKQSPPVLVVKGEAFRPYLKLPNLFVPCGWNVHPPLRRDVVRKLLAEDPATLTWLYPASGGAFVPEVLPDEAFRPLADWIDYVLDHDREALTAWVESTRFDFESFVCDEEAPAKPKKPPAQGKERGPRGGGPEPADLPEREAPARGNEFRPDDFEEPALVKDEPSAPQLKLAELEQEFLAVEGNLDAPGRLALWPKLAGVHGQLRHYEEASACWMNAIWSEERIRAAWAWEWFRHEAAAVTGPESKGRKLPWAAQTLRAGGGRREVSGEDLGRVLAQADPSQADVRALAAYVAWAGAVEPPPAVLAERLNKVAVFLEAHERLLPVRATWLAWLGFVRLTRGDVLALARARDRLLERLYYNPQPERDLPDFLRSSGPATSQRYRSVRQWMAGLCEKAHTWSKLLNEQQPILGGESNHSYIDLVFAYGLARLGEIDASRELLERARKKLDGDDEGHRLCLQVYAYRIKLAQEGKPNKGPLPAELMAELERLVKIKDNALRMRRFLVDRLRERSRIVEPDSKVNAYQEYLAHQSELQSELAEIMILTDREALLKRMGKLLGPGLQGRSHQERTLILRTAVEVAPRVREEFALEVLGLFLPVYDALPEEKEETELENHALLLERGLFLAAHFDRKDHVQTMVTRFQRLLQSQRNNLDALKAFSILAGQSLRGLRKLGMREESDSLLRLMADVILGGEDLKAAQARADQKWPHALRALLHVANGWYFFGRERQAEPILAVARAELFKNTLPLIQQVPLACAYAQAVGQVHADLAQRWFEELFARLRNTQDSYTSSAHYSLSQLAVVEAVVLAIVNDDSAVSGDVRRWLDDDEFLIRRRVHHDYREMQRKH